MFLCVRACVSESTCACVRACVCLYVCLCVCLRVFIRACVCVNARVVVYVCVLGLFGNAYYSFLFSSSNDGISSRKAVNDRNAKASKFSQMNAT